MASDYTKIKTAIKEAKHLTDAERDALVNMLWNTEDDERMLVNVQTTEGKDGRMFLKAIYAEPFRAYNGFYEIIEENRR